MHERHLGDSYDILKKFWHDQLSRLAPVFAHPRFIPVDLVDRYSSLTGIPLLPKSVDQKYALLLDPHTGIPLPTAANQDVRLSHAPISFIRNLFDDNKLTFVICFDQASDRLNDAPVEDQRDQKREWLSNNGIHSFYYVSHAPFLFASPTRDVLISVRNQLVASGIPESTSGGTRLEGLREIAT